MTTTLEQTIVIKKPGKPKMYESAFEKKLMIDNLRTAVEIYGKDLLRKRFKSQKA
jgi:hypothetical protein